mmetsp:Transcript_8941/g.27124  ORF Transcript_8941/g.27124 Transcript_8941/m.27124 type:complete len:356 (-) Transcript_8941:65-1132(-)
MAASLTMQCGGQATHARAPRAPRPQAAVPQTGWLPPALHTPGVVAALQASRAACDGTGAGARHCMAAPERRHRHAGRCAAGSVVQGSIFADGDRPGASYLDFIEGQECADIGVIVSSGGSADGANLPTHIDTDALLLASSESHLPEGECVPGVDPEVAPPLLVPCVAWPQVWTADEARRAESEWMYELSPGHIEELEAATEHLVSSGRAVVEGNYVRLAEGVTAEDFPLPSLGVLLGRVQSDVVHGRGFALLRGLPVERWSRLTSVLTAYGIGLHWGSLRPQNKHAHLVGHVKDTGVDPLHKNPDTRIYLTRAAQPWHVDSVDLVGECGGLPGRSCWRWPAGDATSAGVGHGFGG